MTTVGNLGSDSFSRSAVASVRGTRRRVARTVLQSKLDSALIRVLQLQHQLSEALRLADCPRCLGAIDAEINMRLEAI